MSIGDAAWLAQTQETTLEPDLPICDPHHHLWTHRPEPLAYQEYLLPEISSDINSGHNVRSTVFIEVRAEYRTDGPEEMRPVGEVEFVQKIADESATGTHGPGRAAAAIIGKAVLKLGEGLSNLTMVALAVTTTVATCIIVGCAAISALIDGHTQTEAYRRLRQMAMHDGLTEEK